MLDDATLLRLDQSSYGWVEEQPRLAVSDEARFLDILRCCACRRSYAVFLLNRNFVATMTDYQNRSASSRPRTRKPSRRVRDELRVFQTRLTIDEGEFARRRRLIAAVDVLSEAAWSALETGFMDDELARRCACVPICRSDIARYPLELLRRITQEVVSNIKVVRGPCKPIETACVRALAAIWEAATGSRPKRVVRNLEYPHPCEDGAFTRFCRLFITCARNRAGIPIGRIDRELSGIVRAVLAERD